MPGFYDMLHMQPLFHRLPTRIVCRVFLSRSSTFVNQFLLTLCLTPAYNISIKLKLVVVLTVDKQYRFSMVYSGISIKRTHYKADIPIRRTVWRGTDCFALRSNYLRKNLYKADISVNRTIFFAPRVSVL